MDDNIGTDEDNRHKHVNDNHKDLGTGADSDPIESETEGKNTLA